MPSYCLGGRGFQRSALLSPKLFSAVALPEKSEGWKLDYRIVIFVILSVRIKDLLLPRAGSVSQLDNKGGSLAPPNAVHEAGCKPFVPSVR